MNSWVNAYTLHFLELAASRCTAQYTTPAKPFILIVIRAWKLAFPCIKNLLTKICIYKVPHKKYLEDWLWQHCQYQFSFQYARPAEREIVMMCLAISSLAAVTMNLFLSHATPRPPGHRLAGPRVSRCRGKCSRQETGLWGVAPDCRVTSQCSDI